MRTARGSDSFSWGRDSHEDRLVSATVDSVTTTFAYRGDGLRDSRSVSGGATTTFTWDIAAGLPVVLQKNPISVRPDGTILDGNHRLRVLQERGIDINSLDIHKTDCAEGNIPRSMRFLVT